MSTANGKTAISEKRQQQRNNRKLLAFLGCIVALAACAALMVPAISATSESASEKAGFYLAGQADTSAQEAKAGDEADDAAGDAAGSGASGAGKSGKSEGSDGSDANGTSSADATDADAEGSDDSGADGADDGADGAGQADAGSDSQSGDGADDGGNDEAGNDADGDEDGAGASEGGDADADADADADEGASSGSAAKKSVDGALTFSGKLEDVTGKVTLKVDVEAPEGALPEGTAMEVSAVKRAKVEDAVGEAIAGAAERAASGEAATDAERVAAERARDKVESIQAVDISFRDAEGAEVEPSAPITVKIASPQVERAVGEAATAERDEQAAGVPRETAAKPLLVHIDDAGKTEVVDTLNKTQLEDREMSYDAGELVFDSGDFSVYAIVYTVDFHYEVDGKSYDFSMPGGGFASLTELVEALGLAEGAGLGSAAEFVDAVESVEVSDSELIWVGRSDEDTTVGEMKEANGLACEYSAELSDEQIAEIDAREVAAGDWALISLKPFTSEETLTVTMGNGDVFEIVVTDAAVGSVSEIDTEKQYVLYTVDNGTIYVLKTDGTTETKTQDELDELDNNYKWRFEYVYTDGNGTPYYVIRPCDNSFYSLALNWDTGLLVPLVSFGANNVTIVPSGNGFKFEGYNATKLVLENGSLVGRRGDSFSQMVIYEQESLGQYSFTVETASEEMGKVSGTNENGTPESEVAEFTSITDDNKTNQYQITAVPVEKPGDLNSGNKWLFDYWDLNGTALDRTGYSATIPAGELTIPYQGSTLTAHFKRNTSWIATDEDKEGRVIDKESLQAWLDAFKAKQIPLDQSECKKTAEVYDYENRIYRVDLTAKSNLQTFDGIVDLGFMLDVSGSMKFPSNLKAIDGLSNVEVRGLNDTTASGYYYWQDLGLDTSETYYIIADAATRATVFRIFYQGGEWKRVDASYYPGDNNYDNRVETIGNSTSFGKDNAAQRQFQFYEDADYPKQRRDYEQSSLTNTVNELNSIMTMLSLAKNDGTDGAADENPNVKMAWNTFHGEVVNAHHEFESVKNKDDISITYAYSGGTRTDLALKDAKEFAWENSATKYAILITDGAPQYAGNQSGDQDALPGLVAGKADELKEEGVTLITIGLSMKDVIVGSQLLYDIASTDANGDPYFYSAESGDELQYILYEIIQKIVKPAAVQGDVTDTINEAFYPVDKASGAPLTGGQLIDLEGNVIEGTPTGPYGTVVQTGDSTTGYTYQIKWVDQTFEYGDGWHGTVYVKAKEDFLGGNAVRTNSGNADIQANKYKVQGSSSWVEFNDATKTKGHVTPETPRVNVNELHFSQNESEWTVYLGTEVNPREQLQELYENITVDEVVTSALDTDGDTFMDMVDGNKEQYSFSMEESILDQRDMQTTDPPVTFLLKDVLNLTEGDWDELIAQSDKDGDDNVGITKTYDKYGQDAPGTFTIKLTKSLSMQNPPEQPLDGTDRATTETGTPVEAYTLEVLYAPDYTHVPAGQGGTDPWEFHVGTFGTAYQGHAMGTEDSNNTHEINVFAKKLELQKVDQGENAITDSTATFGLYRKATEEDDDSATKATLPGVTGECVLVQSLTTSGGAITTDALKLLSGTEPYAMANNEPYYLVETKAPDGYNLMGDVLKVSIDIGGSDEDEDTTSDHNTWTKLSDDSTSQTKPDPYELSNWLQEATIMVTALDGTTSSYAVRVGNVTYDSVNDTTSASVTYKIINNAGVELPNTGGSGTMPLYLVGALLAMAGAICLLRRRRYSDTGISKSNNDFGRLR